MEITIKNSWKDISIRDYFKLQECKNDFEVIKILSNITNPEDILVGDLEEIKEIISFITTVPNGSYSPYYEFKGIKFELITNPKKIKAGQWVEIQHYLSDSFKNIHNIIALMLSSNEEYDIDELTEDVYKNYSIQDAYAFFLYYKNLYQLLDQHLALSSLKKMKKEKMITRKEYREMKTRLIKIGDGSI